MAQNDNYQAPYSHNNPKHVDLADVEGYTLEDYGLTVDNIKANHFGIDVTDPRTGEHLPDPVYREKLESAVASVEKKLNIVILPRVISEHHDYFRNEFDSHMFMHTFQKPILQVEKIRMEYGDYNVFNYPTKWWKVYNLQGQIEMLPTLMLTGGADGLTLAQAYTGYPAVAGVPHTVSGQTAPQLFHLEYVGGMLPPTRRGVTRPYEMHPDLWQVIIKTALIQIFELWGRLIIGPGIANMSVSVDGVSQSIDTTQSAMYGGASAEIVQLNSDIEQLMSGLKSYYGINLGLI